MPIKLEVKNKASAKNAFARGLYGATALVGFILSPLSWWNDAVVNIPISLVIASLLSRLGVDFTLGFIAAYWVTNILGIILMIIGLQGAKSNRVDRMGLLKGLLAATLYTILAVFIIGIFS